MKQFRRAGILLAIIFLSTAFGAPTTLSEGFDNVAGLVPAGWAFVNDSVPTGVNPDWFQGDPAVFSSHSGAPDSYLAANFLAAGFGGNIDLWGFTPVLTFTPSSILSFYTRTEVGSPAPDRLEVLVSLNGSSTAVADFSILLLTINPTLTVGGYPEAWTNIQATLPTSGEGRIAFRYNVTDTSVNGDYIGIDDVNVTVPEPGTLACFGLGATALAVLRRRFRRV